MRLIFRIYVRPPLGWCANPNDNKSNMKFSMNLNVPTKLDFKLSSWFLWEAQQILLLQSFDCNIPTSIHVGWQIVQEERFATLKCQDFKECSTFKVFCGLDFLLKIKYSNQNVCFIILMLDVLWVDCYSGNPMQIQTSWAAYTNEIQM